ncbi:MAG TPA: hypothetical protein VI942_07360 [Thermoanaerobaculia bacterium]|nr:hypothetical protein [Thermoanaerobaculia bacterium]
MNAKTSIDARKRTLLHAVERALFDAISESAELHRSLWRLQRAGYTLHLALDCSAESPGKERVAAAPTRASESSFRIDGDDLRFLRSIGIDPTRPARKRRKR